MSNDKRLQSVHGSRFVFLLIFVLLILSSTGCGKGSQLSGLVAAQGTVYYNGAPVGEASITFIPDGSVDSDSTEQRPATTFSDLSGSFKMMTLQKDDGVFPGKYKIVIKKEIVENKYSNEELQDFFRRGMPTPLPVTKNELPEVYGDSKTTPLEIILEKKGNKKIELKLED